MRTRFIILLTVILVFLTGCTGGSDARACTLGEACQYYTGSEGIRVSPDYVPDTLRFSSIDAQNNPELNREDIEYEVSNRGPSFSYGGVFISGLSSDIYDIFLVDNEGNERRIDQLIPRNNDACDFNVDVVLGTGGGILGSLAGGGTGCEVFAQITSDGRVTGLASFDFIDRALGGSISDLFESVGLPFPDGGVRFDDGNIVVDASFGGIYDFFLHGLGLVNHMRQFDIAALGGNPFFLEGQNQDSPGVDRSFQRFRVGLEDWPTGQDQFQTPYEIRTCYGYTTYISPEVCVDTNPRRNTDSKICQADRTVNLGTQGAPVVITRMRQETTRRNVQLWFTIENVGNGRVVDIQNFAACSPYYDQGLRDRQIYDTIYVPEVFVGNSASHVDCDSNKIRLQNGRAELRCTYDLTQADVQDTGYELPLEMELWYGYQQRERRTLRVERID